MKNNQVNLPLQEWIVVSAVIFVLSFFTFMNVYNDKKELSPDTIATPLIEITVHGAVEHPGVHLFPRGIAIEKVLEKVVLLAEAKKNQFKLKSKLYNSQTIEIKKNEIIKIYVMDDKKKEVDVVLGTTLKKFLEDYNMGHLIGKKGMGRMNRKLKDREIIYVK